MTTVRIKAPPSPMNTGISPYHMCGSVGEAEQQYLLPIFVIDTSIVTW